MVELKTNATTKSVTDYKSDRSKQEGDWMISCRFSLNSVSGRLFPQCFHQMGQQ